jgi:chromosome segregation ATPase
MEVILEKLVETLEESVTTGSMNVEDMQTAIEFTDQMYKELYGDYEWVKEADKMLEKRVLTYTEQTRQANEARKKLEADIKKSDEAQKKLKADIKKSDEAKRKAEKTIALAIHNLRKSGYTDEMIADTLGLTTEEVNSAVK